MKRLFIITSFLLLTNLCKANLYIVQTYAIDSAIVENMITEQVDYISLNTEIQIIPNVYAIVNGIHYEIDKTRTYPDGATTYKAVCDQGIVSFITIDEANGFIIHKTGDYYVYYSLTLPEPTN